MSTSKRTAYDAPEGGDTSFRKKYDRTEYALKAQAREAQEKAERKAHYESKILGHRHHHEIPPPSSEAKDAPKHLSARQERLNLEENLYKTTLVPAGAAVGKRGKGAGFYCEACDLTFKDSLQWVDHLNSKQHLFNTGQSFEVEKATLEDVRKRLDWLREKKREQERNEMFDLKKRLEERERVEEEERRERRERRKEKKKLAKIKKEDGGDVIKVDGHDGGEEEEVDADIEAMKRMMGLGGFGTTKKA